MSFPLNPIDCQLTTQNGIKYVYSTSTNSWRRDFNNAIDKLSIVGNYTATSTTTGALVVFNGVGIGGNLYVGGQIYQNGVPVGEKIWTLVTTTYTATSFESLILDSSLGGFTVTLPSNPAVGDVISFIDAKGTLGNNNVIFDRNGELILDIADDLVINLNNAANSLIYSGSVGGWKLGAI